MPVLARAAVLLGQSERRRKEAGVALGALGAKAADEAIGRVLDAALQAAVVRPAARVRLGTKVQAEAQVPLRRAKAGGLLGGDEGRRLVLAREGPALGRLLAPAVKGEADTDALGEAALRVAWLWGGVTPRPLDLVDRMDTVATKQDEMVAEQRQMVAEQREVSDLIARLLGRTSSSLPYDRTADDLSQSEMVERDDVLDDLDAWISHGDGGYLVLAGESYTGKSRLMAELAICPPPDADVVSFFVREISRLNTPDLFLDTVNRQLATLLDQARPMSSDLVGRRGDFRELWGLARDRAREESRPLTLLVDGLDEQASVEVPVSLLLPRADEWSKVLVSMQPGFATSGALDSNEQMRAAAAAPYTLDANPALDAIQTAAGDDLGRLLRDGGDHTKGILAYLAVADGRLSTADLVALGHDPATVGDVVERLRDHLHGSGTDRDGWELGHVELRRQILATLDRDFLAACEEALDGWAEDHADRGWPETTPRYLLTSYWKTLDRRERPDRIAWLLSSQFCYRTRHAVGSFESAMAAATAGLELLARSEAPDAAALTALALRRADLIEKTKEMSALIVEYAACGAWDLVVPLVAHGDDDTRREGLSDVLRTEAIPPDVLVELAAVAESLGHPAARCRLLTELAVRLLPINPSAAHRALTAAHAALPGVARWKKAEGSHIFTYEYRIEMAAAFALLDSDRAVEIALEIGDPAERSDAFAAIVGSLATWGVAPEELIALVERIDDDRVKAGCLVWLAAKLADEPADAQAPVIAALTAQFTAHPEAAPTTNAASIETPPWGPGRLTSEEIGRAAASLRATCPDGAEWLDGLVESTIEDVEDDGEEDEAGETTVEGELLDDDPTADPESRIEGLIRRAEKAPASSVDGLLSAGAEIAQDLPDHDLLRGGTWTVRTYKRDDAFAAIASCYAELDPGSGELLQRAEQLTDTIVEPYLSDLVRMAILRAQVKAGRLDEATQSAHRLQGSSRCYGWRELATASRELGDVATALDHLDHAERVLLLGGPDERALTSTVDALATLPCGSADAVRLTRLALSHLSVSDAAIGSAVAELASRRPSGESLELLYSLASELATPVRKAAAMADVAEAASPDDPAMATRAGAAADDAAAKVSDPVERVLALLALAQAARARGDLPGSAAHLDEAVVTVKGLVEEAGIHFMEREVLGDVARSCLQMSPNDASMLDRALDVAASVRDERSRVEAIRDAGQIAIAAAGEPAGAVAAASAAIDRMDGTDEMQAVARDHIRVALVRRLGEFGVDVEEINALMQATLEGFEMRDQRGVALIALADAVRVADPLRAAEALEEAEADRRFLVLPESHCRLLTERARVLAHQQPDEAWGALVRADERSLDLPGDGGGDVLREIALAMADVRLAGRPMVEDAERVARRVFGIGAEVAPRADALVAVAAALVAQGDAAGWQLLARVAIDPGLRHLYDREAKLVAIGGLAAAVAVLDHLGLAEESALARELSGSAM